MRDEYNNRRRKVLSNTPPVINTEVIIPETQPQKKESKPHKGLKKHEKDT